MRCNTNKESDIIIKRGKFSKHLKHSGKKYELSLKTWFLYYRNSILRRFLNEETFPVIFQTNLELLWHLFSTGYLNLIWNIKWDLIRQYRVMFNKLILDWNKNQTCVKHSIAFGYSPFFISDSPSARYMSKLLFGGPSSSDEPASDFGIVKLWGYVKRIKWISRINEMVSMLVAWIHRCTRRAFHDHVGPWCWTAKILLFSIALLTKTWQTWYKRSVITLDMEIRIFILIHLRK